MNATTENTQSTTAYDRPARQELRRSTTTGCWLHVAYGLARYLDVDATLVRIALVVDRRRRRLRPLYLASWLLIPEDGADQSIAASFLDSRRNR
jgi:phage shock protein PspC (stress-responsive transcriptional regulator)